MASSHKKASGKLKRKNQISDLIHKAEKTRLNENIHESIIYLNQAKEKKQQTRGSIPGSFNSGRLWFLL